MRPEKLLPVLFVTTLSACVTVPVTESCTVLGKLSDGASCVSSQGGVVRDLTLDEYLDFLTPQPELVDPKDPSKKPPARAGAICESASDWNKKKIALEQACRSLGSRCNYETRQAIQRMAAP